MNLSILTPLGTTDYGEIDQITLPTPVGEITVLPHHEDIVTELAAGTLEVKKGNKIERYAAFEGFAKITSDEIKVFVGNAEHADTLDEAKIKEAIERAKHIKKSDSEDVSFAGAAAALERELAKLKTIRRHRGKI